MQSIPFLEAFRFAQSRKIILSDDFYTLDLKTRQLATTVSLLSNLEQIEMVIGSVNKAIANGSTFDEFKRAVNEQGIELNSHYLDLVFRQNVQTAYSQGRWFQQQQNKLHRPYLMYSAIEDSRVRPSHLALNGIVRPIDDTFWLTHYPPIAFRCRCSVISLTEEQATRKGITEESDLPPSANNDFATSPVTGLDWASLLNEKVLDSNLDTRLSENVIHQVKVEASATTKLISLLETTNEETRNLFDTAVEKLALLDVDIRPSSVKTLVDYVQGNDEKLTRYLEQSSISSVDQTVKHWVSEGMSQIQAVLPNQMDIVYGAISLALASQFKQDEIFTLSAPLVINDESNIRVRLEGLNGIGIDLDALGIQGILLEIGTSFKLLRIEQENDQIIYVLKLVN